MGSPTPAGHDNARPVNRQKLRLACNKCAEAKTRCDKVSPQCGRCKRLDNPCSYSPARRIGRPHPRAHHTHNTEISTKRGSASQPKSPPPWPGSPTRAHTAEPIDSVVGSTSTMSMFDMLLLPNSSSSSSLQRQSYVTDDGAAMDIWNRHTSSVGSSGITTPERRRDCDRGTYNTTYFDMDTSLCRTTSTCTTDGPLDLFTPSGSIVFHAEQSDCATTASHIMQRLNTSNLSQHSSTTSLADAPSKKCSLGQEIPEICKQVAVILVCPCSLHIEVALLAGALCVTILDVYDAALLKSFSSPLIGAIDRSATTPPPEDENSKTLRALNTLSKIASVVLQFAERYKIMADDVSTDLLTTMITTLKARLKSAADETTKRFLHVPQCCN